MARRRGGRGGYRAPANPAPASGPGALSRRTDGGPADLAYSGLGYGENKAVNDQMRSAPMPPGSTSANAAAQGLRRPAGGVFAPTDRPNEPMTAGVDAGPGSGRVDEPLLPDDQYLALRALAAVDPTGHVAALLARVSRG